MSFLAALLKSVAIKANRPEPKPIPTPTGGEVNISPDVRVSAEPDTAPLPTPEPEYAPGISDAGRFIPVDRHIGDQSLPLPDELAPVGRVEAVEARHGQSVAAPSIEDQPGAYLQDRVAGAGKGAPRPAPVEQPAPVAGERRVAGSSFDTTPQLAPTVEQPAIYDGRPAPVNRAALAIYDQAGEASVEAFLALPIAKQLAILEQELEKLKPDERRVLMELLAPELGCKWLPQPGPQTAAVNSEADVLLYGGAGGGGKSDLILGLAQTQHKRSLIMRREFGDLAFLTERTIQINKGRNGYAGTPHPVLRTDDDRLIEFGACSKPGDEQSYQGRPHDLLAIDEAAQFLESQIRYLMGWVRTTEPNQRCRVILASNPPLSDEGQWLISMFRPWLDPGHPNPAKPGELRWYITDAAGEDREVDGPGQYPVGERHVRAMSRTFLPARLTDNAYLTRNDDYAAKLDALPEPLRSAVRDGNFMAVRGDAAWQVIPSEWVRKAQARWVPEGAGNKPMTCIAVDVAQGGGDSTVVASRYAWWFAPLVAQKGKDTPDGRAVAAMVLIERKNACQIVVDIGGGWGGDTVGRLKDNLDHSLNSTSQSFVLGYRGADGSTATAKGTGQPFANKRAEDWWRMREALDPVNGDMLALPPDAELLADLCTPRINARAIEQRGEIQIESKEDIRRRLGRSPDKGDAVVMCRSHGGLLEHLKTQVNHGRPRVVLGHAGAKRYAAR
jgi:hypothetical protein